MHIVSPDDDVWESGWLMAAKRLALTSANAAGAQRRTFAVLLVLTALTAACGRIAVPGLQSASPPAGSDRLLATSAGQTQNDLVFSTINGGIFRLSEQRGHVVGMFVMASWCDTCVPSAAAWDRLLAEDGPRGLSALGISGDPGDTAADLAQFASAAKVKKLKFALDPKGDFVRLFHVVALDATFIFDRSGQLVFHQATPPPYPILRDELEKLL
jgi:peroxiredoxin